MKKPSNAAKKTDAVAITKPAAPNNLTVIRQANNSITAAMKSVSDVLSNDPSPEAAAEIYNTLNKEWLKLMENVKSAVREALLTVVEEHGEVSEKGDTTELTLTYNGAKLKLVRAEYVKKTPDEGLVTQLASAKKLDMTAVADQVVSYEPNMDKLKGMVASKHITEEEFSALFKKMPVQLKVEKL